MVTLQKSNVILNYKLFNARFPFTETNGTKEESHIRC